MNHRDSKRTYRDVKSRSAITHILALVHSLTLAPYDFTGGRYWHAFSFKQCLNDLQAPAEVASVFLRRANTENLVEDLLPNPRGAALLV